MTTITRTLDTITLKGHAGYAEPGKDIVCASISVLVQTLIQSVQEFTEDFIECDMKPGSVHIKFWSLSEHAQVLVDSFFCGVGMIAEAYPEHVKIID